MPPTHALDLAGAFDEGEMLPDPLPEEPFAIAKAWLDEARERKDQPNPNAMNLATVDERGRPASRIVLCKDLRPEPGIVVFYSNYNSRKGRELEANPYAALTMHWDHTDRQVRIEGPVVKSPAAESDGYFQRRRWESRLGAWASEQSEPIASRDALLEKVAEKAIELDLDLSKIVDQGGEGLGIPRPPFWGGYRVWAERVELWCAGTGRVHDRARWIRELTPTGDGFEGGPWSMTRLQP